MRIASHVRWLSILGAFALLALSAFDVSSFQCWAQEAAASAEPAPPAEPAAEAPAPYAGDKVVNYALVNTILLISAVLVIFMQAGFALVEVGLNSSKNAVNILAKNLLDFAIGVVLFFAIGYAIMYPGFADAPQKYFKMDSSRVMTIPDWDGKAFLHPQIDFLFQVAFAATAATIVSGAVAGRMKFVGYLIYTAVITGFVYPVSGSWKWGGGWLNEMGFWDFAGSGLVHLVGGMAGLMGAILLGPRIGRFSADGKVNPFPPHNMTFVALGVFVLLIGWYGFNPGSQFGAPTAELGTADITAYGLIAANTTLAACAGCMTMMVIAWCVLGKPDLGMALNGMLAGLVGITANCDCVSNVEALIIGVVAGGVCYAAIILLEMLKIDDPVSAFPVHGACGMWGLIACAAFGGKPWGAQITGTIAITVWAAVTMLICFGILKAVGLLRVSSTEEEEGLDISEHGMKAYHS